LISNYKILIIGLGSIGKKHIKAIKSILPQSEIIALRSNRNSEDFHDVKNIYSLKESDIKDVKFALITNPTSEHKRTVLSLIDYGFPIFIEKPLHSTLDVKDMIALVNERCIITYVGCNLRFLDCLRYAFSLYKTKVEKLNEVNVYCGSFLPGWRQNTDYRKSYSACPELGGGVHLDLIHEVDYLYWFFGNPITVRRSFKNQSSLKIRAFDYCNYLLDYDGFCASVVLNYYRRDPKRMLELVFEDETYMVDLLKNLVICNGKTVFSSPQSISDTYVEQMKYFLNILETDNTSFNSVNNAFEVLSICLNQ